MARPQAVLASEVGEQGRPTAQRSVAPAQDLLCGQAHQGGEAQAQVSPPEAPVPPIHLRWEAGASCRGTTGRSALRTLGQAPPPPPPETSLPGPHRCRGRCGPQPCLRTASPATRTEGGARPGEPGPPSPGSVKGGHVRPLPRGQVARSPPCCGPGGGACVCVHVRALAGLPAGQEGRALTPACPGSGSRSSSVSPGLSSLK